MAGHLCILSILVASLKTCQRHKEFFWVLHPVSIGVCSLEGCLIDPAWSVDTIYLQDVAMYWEHALKESCPESLHQGEFWFCMVASVAVEHNLQTFKTYSTELHCEHDRYSWSTCIALEPSSRSSLTLRAQKLHEAAHKSFSHDSWFAGNHREQG